MDTSDQPIDRDLDIRELRSFIAVAEELHFTRAAARLFVAQQALSRDIRKLEGRLGVALFVRTTRRVTLTPEGERLLERARDLVARHDALWADLRTAHGGPIVVDLLSEGRLTGVRVVEQARADAPEIEFRSRYGGWTSVSLERLLAGTVDVVFGRIDWVGAPALPGVERAVLRLEPLAALLPAGHPLAGASAVRVADLAGLEIDGVPPPGQGPEWADLVRQFLAFAGARSTPPHLPAIGLEEQAYHLVRQGVPILTSVDHVPVPGGVLLPIVDPVPLYPWSMAWRRNARGPGLTALRQAATTLGEREGWLRAGEAGGTWLPEPEADALRPIPPTGIDKRVDKSAPDEAR